jgi:formylglycine-generating enzyme required for sulfatase activity
MKIINMSNRKSLFNNTSAFHIIIITISILFISTVSCKKTEQGKEVTSEKKKVLTNSIGMKFLYISPGTFIQDVTLNRYEVSKSYYLGVTEVTVKQWETFIRETGYKTEAEIGDGASVLKFGNHPSDLDGKLFGYYWLKEKGFYWANPGFTQTENDPITCVKLYDIKAFIKWLNNKEKTDTYYLPTWVEWEYACRAGSKTRFSFGDDEAELDKYAWYKKILDIKLIL